MKAFLLALAAASALAAPLSASPAPAPRPDEVSIPFVRFGGIWNFEARGEDTLYIQDRSRNWYKAELFGPCTGLDFAQRIGVDTRFGTSFDRFSTILVDGRRCPLQSVTRSGPPPAKAKAPKRR